MLVFKNVRDRAVESSALACQQISIDSLPREGVAECHLVRGLFHHQLCGSQPGDRLDEGYVVNTCQGTEQRQVDSSADNCSQHQHLPLGLAQALELSPDGVLHTAWDAHASHWL